MGRFSKSAGREVLEGHERLPEWIAKERIKLSELHVMKQGLRESRLHTVCEDACCPNRAHCFQRGTATFLLLGNTCTRECGFCAIKHGNPQPPDYNEPHETAEYVAALGLKFAVLTSVTRDDLADGGAAHFAATIHAIKEKGVDVEVLVPDFQGNLDSVARVVSAGPTVFNHNLETVPDLYTRVRPGAEYKRSLEILSEAKRMGRACFGSDFRTKSGLMLGLGETEEQLTKVFSDLSMVGVDILTLGQYLRPSRRQLPVYEYVHPDRFEELAELAKAQGIQTVYSGPFVRSSFNAEEIARQRSVTKNYLRHGLMGDAEIIEYVKETHSRTKPDELFNDANLKPLFEDSDKLRRKYYGNYVYLRGLIEFSNICKNDCYYCGIRKSNTQTKRYRMTVDEILDCCERGYALDYRTLVLQSGEDGFFTDEVMCDIICGIKRKFPDCAVTLSLGERSYNSYKLLRDAGADRYLLRHETASPSHYNQLHPREMSLENRKQCLWNLKSLGYQVGCGIMVCSPFQTSDNLKEDLQFIRELQPQMVGIGPFIPHAQTPFASEPDNKTLKLNLTLVLLALVRIAVPNVLLPATTALGTIHPLGRELGLKAGANVVMPILTPRGARENYVLYDGKICIDDEAEECRRCLAKRVESVGLEIKIDRGDYKNAE